jgi:hypothetical protein
MRQLGMMDWRTVQMFLSDDGVHEVQLDVYDNRNMKCTCKRFKTFKKCKHTNWIDNEILQSGGHFSIQINADIPEEEADAAFDDPKAFRDFVVKYGKVEVI